jgi:hypothetical protein
MSGVHIVGAKCGKGEQDDHDCHSGKCGHNESPFSRCCTSSLAESAKVRGIQAIVGVREAAISSDAQIAVSLVSGVSALCLSLSESMRIAVKVAARLSGACRSKGEQDGHRCHFEIARHSEYPSLLR